jgi:aminopeptidase N
VGLHALGLEIHEISVDDVQGQWQWVQQRSLPPPVLHSSLVEHAENSYGSYLELMQSELDASFNVQLPELAAVAAGVVQQQERAAISAGGGDAQHQAEVSGGQQQQEQQQQQVQQERQQHEQQERQERQLVIKIRYSKSATDATVLWWGDWVAVAPSLRRARAWLPCVDLPTALATFTLAVTTAPCHTAVCSGHLKSQAMQLVQQPGGVQPEPVSRSAPGTAARARCA